MSRPLASVLLAGTIVVGVAAALVGLHLQAGGGALSVFGTPVLITGVFLAFVPASMVGMNRYLSRR